MAILNTKNNSGLFYNPTNPASTDPPVKKSKPSLMKDGTARYTLGSNKEAIDSDKWVYGAPTMLNDMTDFQFKQASLSQQKWLDAKAPLDREYERLGKKRDLTIDEVNKISPNFYKHRNNYYGTLGKYGYEGRTLGDNEIARGMKQGDPDAFGKYNYNHYPKLTDRQAYADAVNDGTWKSGTPADLNTGLVGDTSGTYKKK